MQVPIAHAHGLSPGRGVAFSAADPCVPAPASSAAAATPARSWRNCSSSTRRSSSRRSAPRRSPASRCSSTCRGCAAISLLQPGRPGRRGRRLPLHAARRRGADRQAVAGRRCQGHRPVRGLPAGRRDLRGLVRGAPAPELLPGVYGLTEFHRDEVDGADLVANPGCYPTAALLALAPLKQLGLVGRHHRRQVRRERRRQDAQANATSAASTPTSSLTVCNRTGTTRRLASSH